MGNMNSQSSQDLGNASKEEVNIKNNFTATNTNDDRDKDLKKEEEKSMTMTATKTTTTNTQQQTSFKTKEEKTITTTTTKISKKKKKKQRSKNNKKEKSKLKTKVDGQSDNLLWDLLNETEIDSHSTPHEIPQQAMGKESSPEMKINYALKSREDIDSMGITKPHLDQKQAILLHEMAKQAAASRDTHHQQQHQQHHQRKIKYQKNRRKAKQRYYHATTQKKLFDESGVNNGVLMPPHPHQTNPKQKRKLYRDAAQRHFKDQGTSQQNRKFPPGFFPQGQVQSPPEKHYQRQQDVHHGQKNAVDFPPTLMQQNPLGVKTGPPHHVNPSQYNRNKQYQYPQKQLYAQRQAQAALSAQRQAQVAAMASSESHMSFEAFKQLAQQQGHFPPPPPENEQTQLVLPNHTAAAPVSLQYSNVSVTDVQDSDTIRSQWNIGTFIQVWSYTQGQWLLAQIFDITGPSGGILEIRYCDSEFNNGYKKVRRYSAKETRPVPELVEIPPTENRDVIQVGSIVRVYSVELGMWLKAHVLKCQHNGKIHPNGEELIIRYIENLFTGEMRVVGRYGPFVQRIGERKNPPITTVLTRGNELENGKGKRLNRHMKVHRQRVVNHTTPEHEGTAIETPKQTSILTTWVTETKAELLDIFGDEEICDNILSHGVSMPVMMNANKDSVSDIIMTAKKLNAVNFPGIKFTIKDVSFSFVQSFFKLLNEYPEIATLQLKASKACQQRLMPYPVLLNDKIESLHLDKLHFTDDAFKALIFQINAMENIKNLSLSGMTINSKKAKLLGFMLTKNKSLRSLNLGGNNIGDDSAHDIIRGLKFNTKLEELGFQNNSLNSVSTWGESLRNNKTLKVLNLSANNITNTFFLPSGLETLILSSNSLDYNSLGRLLETLIFYPNELKCLDLSHNPIHELLRFGDVLEKNPQLRDLYCDNIGVYDNNLNVLMEALKSSNLRIVSFKSNHLTDQGIYRLHRLSRDFTKIEKLDLRYNSVTIERSPIYLGKLVTLC